VYYPGIPRLALHQIDGKDFTINGVSIVPLPVLHLQLPVMGYRFNNFSYITDAKSIPDATLEKLRGTEVLVLNALQRDPHISHLNLREALEMVEKIKPVQTYLIHISHKLGTHADVTKELPANVALAFDGMQLSL
jgi:phosphoribosyl 1,2-cyclic phosphate phosphodiesterase